MFDCVYPARTARFGVALTDQGTMVCNNTTQRKRRQCNKTQHWTTQHNAERHNAALRNTAQHNTTQHNTAQHWTAEHNATQHTADCRHNRTRSTATYDTLQLTVDFAQHSTTTTPGPRTYLCQLKHKRFKADLAPIDKDCPCAACTQARRPPS
eukprot:1075165-Rhodomonas_salina.3